MFYSLMKIWARVALQFYCSRLHIDTRHLYRGDKPLILACNHPNGFFDALVLGAYYPRKLHFLARGDAFKHPLAAWILKRMYLLPVYRISEGKENMGQNHDTFDECVQILKKGGAVLIFSEGLCLNEWKLRPMKKGTARLAWMCWQDHHISDMVIQPAGINYHSFDELPKRVCVRYEPLLQQDDFSFSNRADFYIRFNAALFDRLSPAVLQKDDTLLMPPARHNLAKIALALPAFAGWLIHKPLFSIWRIIVRKKTKGSIFYDSVLFAGLLLFYPFLLLLFTLIAVWLTGAYSLMLLLLVVPFTAWCYMQFKSR